MRPVLGRWRWMAISSADVASSALIPSALDFDLSPIASGDGGDLLWPVHQRVPG